MFGATSVRLKFIPTVGKVNDKLFFNIKSMFILINMYIRIFFQEKTAGNCRIYQKMC